MKKSHYSPDAFMQGLYNEIYKSPYESIATKEDALKVSDTVRSKAEELFCLGNIPEKAEELKPVKIGEPLLYPQYSLQKYSVEIAKKLTMLFYMLVPNKKESSMPGVVALCGHGYGVRHILNISKRGNKKHFNYFDNYQKNFAVELAKKGCVVIAPELFGFGEARLGKDLIKPFYISSCDELSHHLLPYGLTTASVRIYQAIVCSKILLSQANVDKERIGVMGISGGGLTALYSALLCEDFKRIVVSGYVNSFKDSILSLWHCPDNYIPHILKAGEIYDFASALAPRRLLIESGERDKLFPIDASKKAHESIKRIYKLTEAEDKLVIDIFNGKHSVNGKKAFDFLSE